MVKNAKEPEPEQGKRNPRQDNWYMRGWQKEDVLQPDGKLRTEWVYRGEYYDFSPQAPRLLIRVTAAVCAVILLSVYIAAGIWPSSGGLTPWVAYPYLLELAPLFYFLMGAFWMVYTRGPMTYRRYHASFIRMRAASWLGTLCMVVPLAAEVVFLFSGKAGSLGRELIQILCMLVCVGQYLMILGLLKRYPMEEIH